MRHLNDWRQISGTGLFDCRRSRNQEQFTLLASSKTRQTFMIVRRVKRVKCGVIHSVLLVCFCYGLVNFVAF